MIVRYIDISGIVDNHCLSLFFIMVPKDGKKMLHLYWVKMFWTPNHGSNIKVPSLDAMQVLTEQTSDII